MNQNQSPRVAEFLKEIDAVCRKFGFSISHEDTHGGFVIVPYDSKDEVEWLNDASDETGAGGGS